MIQLTALALAAAPYAFPAQTFDAPRVISPVLQWRGSLASGDFDGDGRLDLLHGSWGLRRIFWFRGQADGKLMGAPRVAAKGIGRVRAVEVSDVDLDGDPDIVAIARNGSDVVLLRNDGTGHFDVETLVDGQTGLGSNIYVLDIDGDTILDVVAMCADYNVSPSPTPILLPGQGGGAFGSPQPLPGALAAYTDLVAFDVDGDGREDLVMTGISSTVSWFRRPPAPGGVWTRTDLSTPPFSRTRNLRAVDLDGDGDLDLASASEWDREASVFENLGGGLFGARLDVGGNGAELGGLEALDVDLDGDLDLVTPSHSATQDAQWVENRGGFVFVDRGPLFGVGEAPAAVIHAADFDADGALDLVLAYPSRGILEALGTLAPVGGIAFDPDPIQVEGAPADYAGATALDVDGDERLDIVTAAVGGRLEFAAGLGAGRFEQLAPLLVGVPGTAVEDVTSVEAIDLDGDGREDLVARDAGASRQLYWLRATATGFDAPVVLADLGSTYSGPLSFVDLEGDGDLDVVFTDLFQGEILVVEQSMAGTFGAPRSVGTATEQIGEIVQADLQGDGIQDLVIASGVPGESFVGVFNGLGGGQFASYARIAEQSESFGVIAADIDQDGDVDLSWFRPSNRQLVRATNAGGGVFATPVLLGALPVRPQQVFRNPLDAPGEVSAVVLGSGTGPIRFVDLTGSGPVVTEEVATGLYGPLQIAFRDALGDGDVDMLVTSEQSRRVLWYESLDRGPVGTAYCGPAVRNSLGLAGRISAAGLDDVGANTMRLEAFDLPAQSTTLFLASRVAGFAVMPGGSAGNLCLGGAVGRFARPGEPTVSTAAGFAELAIDLTDLPQPGGSVTAVAGETWNFQAWHRDSIGGALGSNFTDAVAVELR